MRKEVWIAAVVALSACGEDAVAPDPEVPDPPSVAPEVTAWLDANVRSFGGSHLSLDHDDLGFLPGIVADARLVSLGENTHGTRDFFEMKARILRYLVEVMGFDTFAIEATWPEANRLNHYVRTGEGYPAELLSGLYFWTWNTESVLEMIDWMRSHNEAGGDVGFHGVDMQFPGMALHNLLAFIEIVDPAQRPDVAERVACLNDYANGPDGRFPEGRYADLSAAERAACGESLAAVRDELVAKRDDYESASSPEAFALALQSLRVATQYHESTSGGQSRDESMAENTIWLADHLGPDSRIVLWAHNFHVSDVPGAQGSYLRDHFGSRMVIVGFTHARGRFTAVRQSGTQFLGLEPMTLDAPPAASYEFHLSGGTAPRYALDLRDVDTSRPGASWLGDVRPIRFIGCCYDPGRPGTYWGDTGLRSAFDVILHYAETRPTAVLPFIPPAEF